MKLNKFIAANLVAVLSASAFAAGEVPSFTQEQLDAAKKQNEPSASVIMDATSSWASNAADHMNKRINRLFGYYGANDEKIQNQKAEDMGVFATEALAGLWLNTRLSKDQAFTKLNSKQKAEIDAAQDAVNAEVSSKKVGVQNAQAELDRALSRSVSKAEQKSQLMAMDREIQQAEESMRKAGLKSPSSQEEVHNLFQVQLQKEAMRNYIATSDIVKKADRATIIQAAKVQLNRAETAVTEAQSKGASSLDEISLRYTSKSELLNVKYRLWKRSAFKVVRWGSNAFIAAELSARTMFYVGYTKYNPAIFPGVAIIHDIFTRDLKEDIDQTAYDQKVSPAVVEEVAKQMGIAEEPQQDPAVIKADPTDRFY